MADFPSSASKLIVDIVNAPTKQNPIPKVIALILVSLCGALLLKSHDASELAKLDSMSVSEVVRNQRELHQHSFVFHSFSILILGAFFLGVVEFVTYVIGLAFCKKPDASHEGSSPGKQ